MDPLLEVFCALFVGFILILGSKKILPILGKSGEGGGGGDGVQNKDEQLDADEEDDVAAAASSAAVSRKKGGKKAVAPTRQRDSKNKFSHPWLLCSLKAHNDTILDMQFSPHGKYLATCAEDESSSSCSDGAGVVMCSTTASTSSSPSSSLSSSTESLSSSSSETSPAEHVTAPDMYSATIVVTASSAEPAIESSENVSTTTTSPSLSPSTSSSSLPFDESPTATPSPTVDGSASRRRKKRTKRRPAAKKTSGGSASATGSDDVADDSLEVDEQVLDLPADVVYRVLLGYTLPPDQLHLFGFPQACAVRPGRAYIYRSVAAAASNATSSRAAAAVTLHADAKEFVPRSATTVQPAAASTASDSGVADEDSSSCGGDEEESVGSSCGMERGGAAAVLRPDCLRCGRSFPVTVDGVYVDCPPERCVFHWGKLRRRDAASSRSAYQQQQVRHTCCDGRPGSRGCSTSEQHVWSGLLPGLNGPLRGYMCTRLRYSLPAPGAHAGIYALDCEMCFTGRGLQLARVSVVDLSGRRVYDTLVRPEQPVIDYNTRFSGITARQLSTATRTLRAVQSDLMGFISAGTLLVGHGLENDLRALRLVHGRVIDTSALFPHYRGLPFRHRLSHLTASCLKRRIQADGVGHDSLQDARACMQLLLWRVRNDLGLNAV